MARPRRRWLVAALLICAATAVIALHQLFRSATPAPGRRYEPTAAERRFADEVTRWVVELNRGPDPRSHRSAALARSVARAFDELVAPGAARPDPTVRSAFDELVAQLESLPIGASGSSLSAADTRRLLARMNGLNRRLAEHAVPILLYACTLPSPTRVILQVYRVTSTIELDTPRGIVPVRKVTRLDRLNVSLGLIGFQVHGDAGALPVVLEEQTRQHVIDVILPTLARRELPLGHGAPDSYREKIGPAAGAAIAAQLEHRIRSRQGRRALDGLRRLAGHVADRREIWEQWRERYSPRLVFSRIDFLEPPEGGRELPGVPLLERRRFERAQDAISDTSDANRLVEPLLEWVALRVARHEVQHYVDQIDPPDVEPGRSLAARLAARARPPGSGEPLPPALAELSAYLAEIAADPELPSLTWATLANAAGDRDAGASAAAAAALLALDALGQPQSGAVSDPDRTAATLAAFLALPPAEQALRARQAHEAIFGPSSRHHPPR
ncbi:MAG: hypothetical protein HYY06_14185 [Deltaproteobacteria bacterium]|nr:hypothetical protein [Deltaproteobacteria bacterium]